MENNYYRFNSKGYLNTITVRPDLFAEALEEKDYSSKGGRYIHHMLVFDDYPAWLHFPVSFTVFDGNKLRDVIEMRFPPVFLISERIRNLLKDNGITGWKYYDAIVKDRSGNIIPGYYGFSVTEETPPSKNTAIPDFFKPSPLCAIVCTQKVYDLMKVNKIKDFEFDHIDNEGNASHIYEYIRHLI